jgi:sortase B
MIDKIKTYWKSIRKILIYLDLIVFIATLAFCTAKAYGYYSDRKTYKKIEALYRVEANKIQEPYKDDNKSLQGIIEPQKEGKTVVVEEVKKKSQEEIYASFQKLLSENKETVGWIKIDNTHINYPVVRHSDNNYYLDKDFQKNTSAAGCIFMDYRNEIKPLDRNIILYGHNMKDMTMFRDLMLYNDKDFFLNNDKIIFHTLYQESTWQVFSAYVAEPSYNYMITKFPEDKDFMKYINTIKTKSFYNKDVQVNAADHILTLSTCSYEFPDARLVINGKLIEN